MNKLKEIRKSKHMTLEQVSKKIGLTLNAISQYETGKREASYDTLIKMSKIYGISVDYLLGNDNALAPTNNGTVSPEVAKDIWFATLRPAQQSLIQAILQLNDIQQIKAQAYFAGLLGY